MAGRKIRCPRRSCQRTGAVVENRRRPGDGGLSSARLLGRSVGAPGDAELRCPVENAFSIRDVLDTQDGVAGEHLQQTLVRAPRQSRELLEADPLLTKTPSQAPDEVVLNDRCGALSHLSMDVLGFCLSASHGFHQRFDRHPLEVIASEVLRVFGPVLRAEARIAHA